MFKNVFQKVFGDSDSREIGRLQPVVDEINRLGPEFAAMSDEDLRAQTLALRERIAEKMHDLRQELAEARGAWQEERASAERVQVQVNIERLERELRAAEASALQEILPQAFAAVREAATRTIGLRHYDVQLLGGMILHDGKIAEMKTGEGKTLVASLPLYLNALLGQGCHLVTVNDYLARRDGGWMGRIYHLLGLSVGLVINGMSALYDPDYVVPGAGQEDERLVHWRTVPRREAYQADITYGTNNEYGFDYLRDNIARDITLTVQRPLNYAIVDEVDNILVDEARTPLIISGPAEEATDQYRRFAELVRRLRPNTAGEDAPPNGHFNIDLKTKSVTLTESGIIKIEEMLEEVNVEAGESLYDPQHYELTHYVDNAMRAQYAYHRDRDYVEQNGEIIIVDPNTGRLMQGRRYSEGLHEAIEAKEGVVVQRETMTLATITIQNYFRMYRKRAGMTGTAKTEQEEFHKIYNLDVVAIPTNVEYMASQSRELVEVARKQDGAQVIEYQRKDQPGKPVFFKRADYPDRIFASWKSKYEAVVEEIRERIEQGRPVLVGTISVESSELLSRELERAKIKHTVLNAKLHEKEAHVIVQAGQPGVVTIATNMAGRGTDILLGGNPEGLAMQLVEERCFTVQDAARLARQVVAGQVDQARRDGAGQPGIVDAIVRMHQEFEENVAWVELPGGVPLQVAVRHLVPEFGVTQSTGRDLAALVAAGLGYSAEQRADKLGLRPEIVPWLTRFYNSLAQYMSVSDKGEFLGRRVYEDHYKARAALVRLVLHDELEAARELVRATPALPAELMPAIQGVKRRCADDRQRIWQAGGLHIIGTERHEARRIDNQLRGRSARQGDPGSSQFFVSFDDELMRRFGGERIQGILGRLGGDENVELPASGTLSKTIENLQTKAEAYNYDIRKHLLEFDNVVNKQREVIYSRRRSILEGQRYDLEGEVRRLFLNILEERIDQYTTGYDNWAAGEIDQAIAACSNPVTDEVNAPAVLQRLGGIFAIDAATADELADADAATLREELKAVAAEAAEHGRPYDLLAIELHNLLLFLPPLPSVEAIYGARSVAEARDGTRGAYLAQLTGLLDRLRSAVAERGGTVDEAAFREQRQHAADGVRKIFEIVGRERPSRDQLKQEQRAVERQLSDLAVETVAHCLAGIPRTELHTLAEGLFEQKLAEAYEQLGRGNYAGLDTAEARAQDLKSLSELDAEVLRTNLAGILSVLDRDRLAALIDDLCQDAADADRDAWEALGRSRDIAALDDDQVTALGTALFDSLSPEVRSMLAGLSAERVGVQAMREFCQAEMLGAIDVFWPQHLTAMDELREGIGLQAFAQRDPLVEFSRQSFGGFERLLVEIDRTVIDHFFQDLPRYQAVVAQHRESLRMQEHLALSGARVDQSGAVRKTGNLGRNDPCWCGSGKKYKYCHMRSDQAQAGGPAPQAAVTQAAAAVSNGRSAPRGAPPAKSKAGKRK